MKKVCENRDKFTKGMSAFSDPTARVWLLNKDHPCGATGIPRLDPATLEGLLTKQLSMERVDKISDIKGLYITRSRASRLQVKTLHTELSDVVLCWQSTANGDRIEVKAKPTDHLNDTRDRTFTGYDGPFQDQGHRVDLEGKANLDRLVRAAKNGVEIRAKQNPNGFPGMGAAPSQNVQVAAGDGALKFMYYSNGTGAAHKDSVQNNVNNVVCARRVAHLDCNHALMLKIKHEGVDRWALIDMGDEYIVYMLAAAMASTHQAVAVTVDEGGYPRKPSALAGPALSIVCDLRMVFARKDPEQLLNFNAAGLRDAITSLEETFKSCIEPSDGPGAF